MIGSANTAAPTLTSTIGNDSGRRAVHAGTQAASRNASPASATTTRYAVASTATMSSVCPERRSAKPDAVVWTADGGV